ncbi:Ubiquinol oxidase 4, chloroplastic/chromoplastic-like protein [Drosera capensis]
MAALLFHPASAVSMTSSSVGSYNQKLWRNSTPFNSHHKLFSLGHSAPLSRSVSSTSLQIRSAVLQGKEEKVVVEESFQAKSIVNEKKKESDREKPPESSTSVGFEKLVIKIEQSINIFLTDSVIKILDTLYHDRHYARFFVLETIARVPYFAFMSVLHLYESFGWWRRADYLKVHFAESWNEMHHLLIMEELGGNSLWFDRFLSQHIAVFYYFMIVFMYAISPRMAYELKKLPAPEIAVQYYTGDDMYLFDEFQTSRAPCSRRPKIENLYDVFLNIRDDEAEHCKTMKACQTHGNLKSPHSVPQEEEEDLGCDVSQDCEGIVDCLKKSVMVTPVSKTSV